MSADILGMLLEDARQDLPVTPDLDTWWTDYAQLVAQHPDTLDRALRAGARASAVAYAFASGYQAALASTFGANAKSALLVTEEGGGHPRALRTELVPDGAGFRVRGTKTFATLGTFAEIFYVLVRVGDKPDGRPDLRVVTVPREAEGVVLGAMKPAPFCPELPHVVVHFDDVYVDHDALVPGDGYEHYALPFRTEEDLHVVAALTGYLLRVSVRHIEEPALVERLLANAALMRGLFSTSHDAYAMQRALAVAIQAAEDAYDTVVAALFEGDTQTREALVRDRTILKFAQQARVARLDRARRAG